VPYSESKCDVIKNESVVKNGNNLWFCVQDLVIITENNYNLEVHITIIQTKNRLTIRINGW